MATLRRKFQYTDLIGNNNKFWMIEVDESNQATITWGRVGDAGQSQQKYMSPSMVENKIAEKLNKGYVEVDLHRPQTVVVQTPTGTSPALDPQVDQMLTWIIGAANTHINSYLAGSIDALSQAQIKRGRDLLEMFVNVNQQGLSRSLHSPREILRDYYNVIPTQLPRRIDPDELLREFDVKEQEQRLDQLEAALSTSTVTVQGQADDRLTKLGCELKHVPTSDKKWEAVERYAAQTLKARRLRVTRMFNVKIPSERSRYEAETFGAEVIAPMWHGTASPNIRHILNQGLRLPRSAANGWRFGPGIYLSDAAFRSTNYCRTNYNEPMMLFVCEAKIGKAWENSGSDQSMRGPKPGYHSTHGTGSWSNNGDEYIVYRESQVTIRAIVTVE